MNLGLVLNRSSAVALLVVIGSTLISATHPARGIQAATPAASPAQGENAGGGAKGAGFASAIDLLPGSTAGVVRIPDLPAFCQAWKETNFGRLLDSPEMQPFLDEQRKRATNYFDTLDQKIGLKPQDLYDIASGEVVLAWLAFPGDKKRPYSLTVIADVRGRLAQANSAAAKIDKDLKAGGAARRDISVGDETIRVYRTKPKPGQLKIEEIAVSWNQDRFIAADRVSVIEDLLKVIAGQSPTKAFSNRPNYQQVLTDSSKRVDDASGGDGTVCWQWYAEPFAMGRILREVFEYDRRDDLDVLELLERQGFSVIEALGGVGVVAGKRFDIVHCGEILAPNKLAKAAKMLQAFNVPRIEIPDWPTDDSGAFHRVHWRLEEAFWAAEPLVNDAMGDDIFRPILDGIRDDPDGPQIDLAKDFIPNLDDEIILVTDNTMPATLESDRMLIALRVKDAQVVARVIRKGMEVEPDATKLDFDEFDVWEIKSDDEDPEFDAALLELGFEEPEEEQGPPMLLSRKAVAVVEGSTPESPDYLMFSSSPELLIKLGKRIRTGAKRGSFASTDRTQTIVAAMKDLGADEVTYDGVFHPSLSLRAKYELLRQGKLRDSDSLGANLLRRIVDQNEEGDPDPIQAGKLPPFAKIESFLSSGGTFWQKTDSGWSMTGFLMAE